MGVTTIIDGVEYSGASVKDEIEQLVCEIESSIVSNSVICPDCDGKRWTIPTDRVPFDCERCKGTGKL